MLRSQWPAIAARFGVLPWHWDGGPAVLTMGEQHAFVEYVKQQNIEAAFEAAKRDLPGG